MKSSLTDQPTHSTFEENAMHPILVKTFGGLSAQYYFRNFIFGAMFFVLLIFTLSHGHQNTIGATVFFAVNTALYPYSRFVYESVMNFIMGRNVFFVNAALLLIAKAITMLLCWFFAIFVAPVGLAYLYYHHSKAEC
jgi:hypothetical protein